MIDFRGYLYKNNILRLICKRAVSDFRSQKWRYFSSLLAATQEILHSVNCRLQHEPLTERRLNNRNKYFLNTRKKEKEELKHAGRNH